MQRLRTTFKRSRTPTGADMKQQNSLEVPRQVRSASFDEIKLEAHKKSPEEQDDAAFILQPQQLTAMPPPLLMERARHPQAPLPSHVPAVSAPDCSSGSASFLRVPTFNPQRSKSFDSGSGGSSEDSFYLEVPRRFQRRRSSSDKTASLCVHCQCLEEYERLKACAEGTANAGMTLRCEMSALPPGLPMPSSSSSSSLSSSEIDLPSCSIRVTLDLEDLEIQRRHSITPSSPHKLSRQEAFFVEGSFEYSLSAESDDPVVGDIFLEVPELPSNKRDRAASVDTGFAQAAAAEGHGSGKDLVLLEPTSGNISPIESAGGLAPPNVNLRSRSVDIVLPTGDQERYKALATPAATNVRLEAPGKKYVMYHSLHAWIPSLYCTSRVVTIPRGVTLRIKGHCTLIISYAALKHGSPRCTVRAMW